MRSIVKSVRLLCGLLFTLVAIPAMAATVSYPFRVVDNSGNLVSGATVVINGTTLTSGTPSTVAGKVLGSGATLSSVSVTYYDFGSGDYVLTYDPAANGEAYFPITVSKSGSAITGANALVGLVCALDSSKVNQALPNAAPNTSGGLPTIGTGSGQINPSSGTFSGVGLATGQNVATIGGLAPPANWNLAAINGSGQVAVSNFPATVSLSSGDETHLANADTQSGTGAAQATAANNGVSALSTKIGNPAGASISADIAAANTAVAALPTASTIANAVLAATIDGTITLKQATALKLAIMTGKYTTSTSNGVTTTTYYRQDGTTVIATSTVSTSGGTTTRTWILSNLP